MSKLGEVFVEILGDSSPFADEFAEAIGEAGGLAATELGDALSGVTEDLGDDFTEAGEEAGAGLIEGITGDLDEISDAAGAEGQAAADALDDAWSDVAFDAEAAFDGVVDEAAGAAMGANDALDAIELDVDVGDAFSGVVDEAMGAAAEAADAFDDLDIDVDAGGAFDAIVSEAEGAAEEIVDAFDGIGDAITDGVDEAGGAFDGLAGSIGSVQGALGTAAGGAGIEAYARQQLPLTEQTLRLAQSLDTTEESIRDMALASSDVTRPLGQVLETMEIGRQQGVKNTDQLMEFVAAWDLVGDASGENADELAKLSPALAAVGIEAHETEKAHQAFGYMLENTTMSVGEFMNIVNRMGPDLRDMNLDVDDTAALLGAMQGELGLTGRVARTEFSKAVKSADGDMSVMLDTLGLSAEQVAEYRAQVEESSGIIQRNADIHADSYTPIQRFTQGLEDLSYRFGGVSEAAGMLAAPLGAIGPSLLFANQGSQLLASGMGTKLVSGLKGAAMGFKTLSVAILTNPLFLIVAAVVAIVAIFWYFREEIMAALGAAFSWVGDKFGDLMDWFTGLPGAITEAIGGLATDVVAFIMKWHPLAVLYRLIVGNWAEISAWLGALPGNIVTAVGGLATTVLAFILQWHPLAILYRAVTGVWPSVLAWLTALPGNIITGLSGLASTVVTFIARWHPLAILQRAVTAVWPSVQSWLTGLPGQIVSGLSGLASTVLAFIVKWNPVSVMYRAVTENIGALISFVTGIPGRIVSGLGNLGRILYNAGADLIEGLLEGAGSLLKDIGKFFLDFLPRWIRRPFEKAMGIKSPSTVFAGYGQDLVAGLEAGLDAGAANIAGSVGRLADEVSNTDLWDDALPSADTFADLNVAGLVDEAEALGVRLGRGIAAGIVEGAEEGIGAVLASVGAADVGSLDVRSGSVRPQDVAAAPAAVPLSVTQHIYTTEPRVAAAESVRRLRDRVYLNLGIGGPNG